MHVFTELRGPITAVREEESGNPNAGFVRTTEGTIIIDALRSPAEGAALLQAAQAGSGRLRALIYTHEHVDHLGGSTGYPALEVAASEGTDRGIRDFVGRYRTQLAEAGLNPLMATLVFDSSLRFLGDPEVRVVELGGHATGSSVVYIPSERVLFAGDLIFLGRLPWVGTGSPRKWAESLRTLEEWDIQTVVPGHGPIAGKEVLAEQRSWLEAFATRLEELQAGGTAADAALKTLDEEFGLAAGGYSEPLLQYMRQALTERFGFTG